MKLGFYVWINSNNEEPDKMKTPYMLAICLLFVVTGITTIGINPSVAVADSGKGFTDHEKSKQETTIQNHDVITNIMTDNSSKPLGMSLREFVRLVREKNEQISFQDSEWAISREAVKGAKAIFEPAFINSYQYQEDKRRTTVQEKASQGFFSSPDFQERSGNYQAAVEGLAPTGGKLRFGYTRRDFKNNYDDKAGVERESQSVIGASITQPLLKGGGIMTTMAGIQVAKTDADIAFQSYRGQMMRVISEAIATYWDLSLAREKYKLRKDSERTAEQILKDNLIRVKTGKMAETEVLEARAGLAMRKSLVSEASQVIVSAMNSACTFMSFPVAETKIEIEPTDRLEIEDVTPVYANSLATAFKLRAEYISSRKKIEREDIRMAFAENQTWPQLDLKGSYNLNGLSDTPGNSWEDAMKRDYATWFVGLELRVPLGGDKKSQSELEATRQRKRQALLELKAVEVSLANTLETAVQSVHNVRDQVRHYANVVDMNRRLLEAEIERFNAGKSNSRLLLEREENLNKAKEAEIESLARYRKSLLQLDLAEGSLLVNHGVEIMEAGL